jgi:putative peptide zinc metalloprotease protein
LALSALLLIGVQFEVFQARLPGFHEFFDPRAPTKWLYLALVMAAVKVVHELGHGLSCKHFGGECHEIGFMLLVFTPCLYCNVSDSWMLPSKWRRAMIGAAGMYVEVVMASAATFVWWFSDPATLLNQMSLNVMFICSVSTLVFNGNPLLRFDGYYIMMDLTEIPNLRQKATEVLKRFLVGLCLGLEQPENPFLPQKNRFFFGFYSIAAVCYRWLVVFSIMMFMNQVLEPYGLKVIGRLLGLMGFFGLVVQPLWQMGKFFYMPGRMHKVKKVRVAISLAVVVGVIAAIVLVPLPHSVKCTFEVGPRDAASIYVDVPGRVEEILVKEGQRVTAGQTLVQLSNPEMEIRVAKLKGRRDVTLAQIDSRQSERVLVYNSQAGGELDELREILSTTTQQLTEQNDELARLKIVAPIDGIVIPSEPRPKREEEGKLPGWSGSALDEKNIGATYLESERICRIGDPNDLEALLVVDQADIDLVDEVTRDGEQPEVKLQLDAYPGRTLTSHVVEVARVEMKVTPASLSAAAGGKLETKTDDSGIQRPMSTSYQARVPLDEQGDLEGLLCTGMRGDAQIYTKWQSLGKRLHRYIARTFHFEL